jgi:hypothetical protein
MWLKSDGWSDLDYVAYDLMDRLPALLDAYDAAAARSSALEAALRELDAEFAAMAAVDSSRTVTLARWRGVIGAVLDLREGDGNGA